MFLKTNGDIREVVRTIVTSNEFYSQQAFRSKVKSPFEVVVSAMRALNAQPDSTPRTPAVIAFSRRAALGDPAPNGYPETATWMNTGAILNRIDFGLAVAANRIPGATLASLPESTRSHTRSGEHRSTPLCRCFVGSVSPDTRAVLMKGESACVATTAPSDARRPRRWRWVTECRAVIAPMQAPACAAASVAVA